MKKVKFKERVENARNAFFADESFDANDFLSRRNQNEFFQNAESEKIAHKISALETILKQVLLFFPGTFVLYTHLTQRGELDLIVGEFEKLTLML